MIPQMLFKNSRRKDIRIVFSPQAAQYWQIWKHAFSTKTRLVSYFVCLRNDISPGTNLMVSVPMASAKKTKQRKTAKEWGSTLKNLSVKDCGLTFSWLKESILLMAVSKAVMDSRKAWSCSHSGLLSRSAEIFTAALDMADRHKQKILL